MRISNLNNVSEQTGITLKPSVFIVILHYGKQAPTRRGLDLVKKLTYSSYKIILVDNDPNQSGVVFKDDIDIYLRPPENLGFPGGNNFGFRSALSNGAEYILVLNNDAEVRPDLLDILVEIGESDKKIGIICPLITDTENLELIVCTGSRFNWKSYQAYPVEDSELERLDSVYDVDIFPACCVLVKKEVLVDIGGFDDRLFFAWNDDDWCLRIRKKGYRITVVQKARVAHRGGMNVISPFMTYMMTRNEIFYASIVGLLNIRWMIQFFIRYICRLCREIWARPYLVNALIYGYLDACLGQTGLNRGKSWLMGQKSKDDDRRTKIPIKPNEVLIIQASNKEVRDDLVHALKKELPQVRIEVLCKTESGKLKIVKCDAETDMDKFRLFDRSNIINLWLNLRNRYQSIYITHGNRSGKGNFLVEMFASSLGARECSGFYIDYSRSKLPANLFWAVFRAIFIGFLSLFVFLVIPLCWIFLWPLSGRKNFQDSYQNILEPMSKSSNR